MTLNLVTHLDRPNCADPAVRDIVDASFGSRGPAAERMRRRVCPGCPAMEKCFNLGMQNPVNGVWGGVTQSKRVAHGAPAPTPGAVHASANGAELTSVILKERLKGRPGRKPAA